MHQNKRVLFVCRMRNNPYGISIGLVQSAESIANYLNSIGMVSKVVSVVDSNGIDKEVYNFKPTHVVIHAIFVPQYKILELCKKYPNIKWQIRIHSKVEFIANEGIAMDWINKYEELKLKNLDLTANSNEFCDAIYYSLGYKFIYLPNLYMPSELPPKVIKQKKTHVDIGCFGAIRPLKNQLLQGMVALAFSKNIGKPIHFHINADRSEQHGDNVLKNLRAIFATQGFADSALIEHPWKDHEDFLEEIAKMDIGMQISISETYNIVSADFVYVGVPIIVSDEIDWMPFYTKVRYNNFEEILCVLENNYKMDNFAPKTYCGTNRLFLEKDNHKAEKIWKEYLKGE